ncbi:MAG: aspartate ammonia-lyase [Nitrososphaeria archaeon]|nr:aspartate ammonia-lyase [Nitrososphaeria archaeon]NDB51271.1 aspartate ammonia-lyase [Nitrosopumilaceae archaeon]NDB88103.1 aspartate ammonia-lyase [Nitrososphaerota archaeon]NDB62909.1 aspartate ammonia-lyase [Nitrosopumilaceae archaeon]NDB89813.1 aspartate ammonia-lyase [Nitrososphaerota archaeon]
MEYRIDRDSLGEVKIPSDAYYGAFTGRAIQQYHVTGRKSHKHLISAFVMIKRSAAVANIQCKTIDKKLGTAIISACDKILAGKYQEGFVIEEINSGAGTAFNMNSNEVICNVALEIMGKKKGQNEFLHPNDHVNMSQSSNDTFPTAMHVAILLNLKEMMPAVDILIKSLSRKTKEFSGYKKIGRTHLMDALPVTLGSEFAAYVTSITKAKNAITLAIKELELVGLGGTAVGNGANTPKGYRKIAIAELAKISGLKLKPEPDMQHALQSKFAVANVSGAIRNLALELNKIANDIRLMASGPIAGLSELGIPAVHAGSSIMPGKVNPSLAECLNMICFSVIGNDTAVANASQGGQFELNVMLPGMLKAVLDSTDMLKNFLPIFSKNLIDGLTANEERLRQNIEKSPVIVTLLAPKIGYQKSADLFKESLKTGKTIRELVLEQKLLSDREVNALFK